MKFELPKKLPGKQEFFTKLLDTIFPDMEEMGLKRTANGYKAACRNAIKELGVADSYNSGDYTGWMGRLDRNANMYSVIYEINEYDKNIYDKDNLAATDDIKFESLMYKYSSAVSNLVGSSGKTMNSLLDKNSNKIYKSFEVSAFFSYLLINREKIHEKVPDFINFCLKCLGITDIEEEITSKLKELKGNAFETVEFNGCVFPRTRAKGARIIMLSVLTLCRLIGRFPDTQADKPEKFFNIVKKELIEDFGISELLSIAKDALFKRVIKFEPRTVNRPGEYFLKDFYVDPVFEKDGELTDPPLKNLGKAKESRRGMITGMTGYGKTMYMNMFALGILTGNSDLYESADSADDEPLIISVTANDFTECYTNEKYREWTNDLAWIFFMKSHCMAAPGECGNFEFPKGFRSFLLQLAEKGKLILLLDSFDEVPTGEIRDAYLKSVRLFCDEYCSFLETGKKGAHVFIATREMSPDTMQDVAVALKVENDRPQDHIYRIKGLDEEGRKKLIGNWLRYSGDDDRCDEIIEMTRTNHFFRDSAQSPYTLSMLCAEAGNSFGRIMDHFIAWLKKMLGKRVSEIRESLVKNVMSHGIGILEKLALETMKSGNYIFGDEIPEKILNEYIDAELRERGSAELSETERENKIRRIKEILVMQSGIVTHTEGDEDTFSFTDRNLRIALASKRIKEMILSDRGYVKYRKEIYGQMPADDYADVMVPVICSLSSGHTETAQMLIQDLASVYTKDGSEEESVLRSLTDLVLDRYSLSILSIRNPGIYDERYVLSAQRMAVMRLMSSGKYDPEGQEAYELNNNPVVQRALEGMSF